MKRGDEVDHCPEVVQEDEPPVENEWGHSPHNEEEHLNRLDKDAPNQMSHYEWDEELNEGETPSFWENALSTPEWGYCERKCHAVTHDVSNAAHGSNHEHSKFIRFTVGVTIEGGPPLSDHRVHRRTCARPSWARDSNQTLSGYWEVNGTKAHCLLDSRCEGVIISPNYTQATGIKTFKLEHPIGLQLACIGSKSTLNYGAHSSIAFSTKCVNEYFNVINIDHYNVILGTPFLRRLGITLDFSGQGVIHLGAHEVSRNLPLTPVNEKSNA